MSGEISSSNACDSNPPTSKGIKEFYKGANVLLTGATGFIGKVVLEKLLRSCTDCGNIYVLIRPKQEFDPENRLKQLLESPAFDRVRKTSSESFRKVKLIDGDLEEENIGLSGMDRKMLVSQTNIVLHPAANVSFTQTVEGAIRSNTFTTKRLLTLCKDMANLKSFVHVSTTFKDRPEVEEIIYKFFDPNFVLNCVEALPSDTFALIAPKLMGNYINTYALSKALSEVLVSESFKFLPICIVRPSIVHSSWKEPFPGWVDSLVAYMPYVRRINQGIFKTILGNREVITDVIPVDVAANTIITAAWHSATHQPSQSTRIYNCTSGTLNKITLGQFFDLLLKYIKEFPSRRISSHPDFTMTTDKTMHRVKQFVYHLVPAHLYDAFLSCSGRKPRMVQIYKRTAQVEKLYEQAMLYELKFHATNFVDLIEAVGKTEDGKDFNIDIRKGKGFDWDSYIKDYQLVFRKLILKDDISSLDYAKTKLKRLYWINKTFELTIMCTLIGLVCFGFFCLTFLGCYG